MSPMSPSSSRLPSIEPSPIGFAHRGAKAQAPENTIEAFTLALRLGATGLETDAFTTADDQIVLDHDGEFRVGWRTRLVRELRRDQLPGHVPTLAELLMTCGIAYHLSIDLKDDRVGPLIIAEVRAAAPELLPRLWLCHPSVAHLAELRPLDPDVRLVNSTRLKRMDGGPERRAAELRDIGIDCVNLHHTDWSGGLVALFHRFERHCFAWDLQHDEVLDATLAMGVDGVFSDWTERMVDALTRLATL
jgi:glycerophosphoryl diester phosphodiesterase